MKDLLCANFFSRDHTNLLRDEVKSTNHNLAMSCYYQSHDMPCLRIELLFLNSQQYQSLEID